jgi:multidrug efflux pump subunit AcrA (membrane-fusion protein)
VLRLVSMEDVEVHAAADPVLVARIAEGTPATLRFAGETLPASVAGVVRAIDSATGTAPLRIVPTGTERPAWLLPGRFLDVEVELPEEGGVVVPRDAVTYGVRGARVVRVVDGAAQIVAVEVVVQAGDQRARARRGPQCRAARGDARQRAPAPGRGRHRGHGGRGRSGCGGRGRVTGARTS